VQKFTGWLKMLDVKQTDEIAGMKTQSLKM